MKRRKIALRSSSKESASARASLREQIKTPLGDRISHYQGGFHSLTESRGSDRHTVWGATEMHEAKDGENQHDYSSS